MNLSLLSDFRIIAQAGGAGAGGPSIQTFIPIILMMVVFYFLLIRPQRRKQKALDAQLAAMKVGDKVISAGGIHGMVANIKDGVVVVKVADNVKIEFDKSSIATVIGKGSSDSAPLLEDKA